MNTNNQMKRLFTLLLALVMVIGMMPFNVLAADSEPIVVIAASDYQNNSGGYFSSGAATDAYAIMSAIKEDYSDAYGFLFGGDYYAHDTNTTTYSANGKKQLKEEIVDVLYPSMSDDTQVYIQGNHDADSLTTNGTLSTSGAHDTEHYGVYVINEKDYMWYNNSQSTIKATASTLESYLNDKMDDGYGKPIFVLSHLPLHYTNRTKNEGDGKYAKYIYDVLDEAGANDLNIIFLYGHNHSTAYDSYLGNGSVYLPEGSTMAIANEGSTSSYFTDTLTFTYMNYGFVGYVGSSNADSALTMTVFEIYDDAVTVKRYDEDGLHNLKSAGGNTQLPSGLSVDSTVIGTAGASIALSAPKEKATFTSNGVTVSAVGLTSVTAAKEENPSYNAALYSGYEVYTITAAGYETGKNASVSIALTDGDFDAARSITIQFPDGHTKNVTAEDNVVSFETDEMGTYVLMQNQTTGIEIPDSGSDDPADGNIWRQATSFTAGKNYILVNYGDNASGVSEYAINSSAAPTAVSILSDSDGVYIENENMAIAWTAEANEGQVELVNADTGKYLYISSYPSGTSGVSLAVTGSVTSGTNYSNWSMETTGSGETSLAVRRATSSNYYPVRYSAGGTEYLAYTSSQTSKHDNWIAIFEQTSEGSSSETVVPDAAEGWFHLPAGGTYVLDTDGIDVGEENKYIIVGSSNAYALTVSGGAVGQEAVTISGNTITVDDPAIYEFWFADNSSRENKTYLLTQDGSNTVYHANGNMYYGSDSKGYWYISSASNGAYQIYDYDNMNWYLNYGYVWSSEATSRFAVSSNSRYVRLYKGTGAVYGDTYVRLAGQTQQECAIGTSETEVLSNIYVQVTTDGYLISDIISVSSDMVSWNTAFDGNTTGTYTGTVTYSGVELGTITVTVANNHSYVAVVTAPTCTEQGYTTYTCTDCGDSYVADYVAAAGHSYESAVTAPTCTEGGYTAYTCAVCGDAYTADQTDALGHTYESVTVAPSCTAEGSVTYTCACGDSYTETIAATGHSYEAIVTTPTCTEQGYTTYTCACGDGYVSDYTDALGHDYKTVTVVPTCTEEGSVTYTCACGDSYTETIAATGHSHEAAVTAPTCTDQGYTTYTCACGDSYVSDYTDALGHDYETVTVAPTCTTGGYTTNSCTICGEGNVYDETAALGHDYVSVTVDATCTEAGSTTHTCTACGDSYEDAYVAALGHANESVVTEATCETDGYTTHTCTICGNVTVDSHVEAFGHDYETVTVEATCTDAGSVTSTCATCGHTTTEVIEALGHSYETVTLAPTCTEAGYTTHTCARCDDTYVTDQTDALGHAYHCVTVDATCTENGAKTYTCACGDTYTVVLDALGHRYETTVTEVSCETDGYTTHTCTVCGDSYITDQVAAPGHAYETVTVAPTCTEAGYTTHTCTACGHSYVSGQTAALGHSYSAVESDAYMVYTCSHCGDSYSEKIANTYTKVTALSADNAYVITLYSGSKYYALSHANNQLSVVQISVSNGEITSEISSDLVWNYSSSKLSYEDNGATYYLYASSSNNWWGSWFGTATLSLSTTNSSTVSFSSSKLKVGSYYLRYSGGSVSLNRSVTTTYLFVEE